MNSSLGRARPPSRSGAGPNRRLLASLLALPLFLTTLACGLGGLMPDDTPKEPVHPREHLVDIDVDVHPTWKAMDLPWYGATSKEPCTERSLTVSYIPRFEGVTPEQLRTWWPEALVAEGLLTRPTAWGPSLAGSECAR